MSYHVYLRAKGFMLNLLRTSKGRRENGRERERDVLRLHSVVAVEVSDVRWENR